MANSTKVSPQGNLQQNNYSVINDFTPVGIVETTIDGTIVYYNTYFSTLVGHDLQSLMGTNIQNLLSSGGKIFFITSHLPVLKLNNQVTEINYDLINKVGARIPVLMNSVKYLRKDKNQFFLQFVIVNFPKRKKYENDLLEAKRKAEESTLIKSKFVATVTHELRTPVHTILNSIDFLKNNSSDPTQTEIIDSLQFASNNLLYLINSVLDLSKREAGHKTSVSKDIELRKILQHYKKLFHLTAAENNTEIEISYDDSIPAFLMGDVNKLNQILTNLIGNALKFTKNGKVTISASLVQSNNEICKVRLEVKDSGIGIKEEDLQKIFIPFSQANKNISSDYGGTGLGLSISQNLLIEEGSSLQVESVYGKGSTFFFEIEYLLAKPENKKYNEKIDAGSMKGIRVLVVDDVTSNLSIASRYLTKWNIAHETVEHGNEAIQAISKNHYHIIVMDVNMPDLDGYETSKLLREKNKINDYTRIILSSANYSDKSEEEIKEAGVDDFLLKPFNAVQFYDILGKNITELSHLNPGNYSTKYIDSLFDDDVADKKAYYNALLNDTVKNIALLEELQTNPTEEKVRFVAHNMISNIKIFEIEGLSEKFDQLKVLAESDQNAFSMLLDKTYKMVLQFSEWLRFKMI